MMFCVYMYMCSAYFVVHMCACCVGACVGMGAIEMRLPKKPAESNNRDRTTCYRCQVCMRESVSEREIDCVYVYMHVCVCVFVFVCVCVRTCMWGRKRE